MLQMDEFPKTGLIVIGLVLVMVVVAVGWFGVKALGGTYQKADTTLMNEE
jgi:hypothetical protein